MNLKRFFIILFIATGCFLAGVAVGRFVMPKEIHITVIDIKDMADIIERYNELKYEFEKIKEWNEEAVTESASEEENK